MRLLKLILATWRLTYMLRYERGLFGMGQSFREVVAPSVANNEPPETELEQAVDCFYCFSVHIALMVLILERVYPVLVDILALSSGAIAMEKWNSR